MGIENVRTGLRRKLEESESEEEDEDEDEDEEMEDAGVQVTSARRSSMGQVEFGMSEVNSVIGPGANGVLVPAEKTCTVRDI